MTASHGDKRVKPTAENLADLANVHHLPAGDVGEMPEADGPETGDLWPDRWSGAILSGSSVLDLPPVRWIVPQWLPENAVTAIYGLPGSGKSFYALTMALELASGGTWAGHTLTEPLRVLYVAAERPYDLRDRVEAWKLHTGREIPETFGMLPPVPDGPNLLDDARVSGLCQVIREHGYRVVILDTFARLTVGIEENSSRDTGPVLERLERIREATDGGAVTFVHHSGKDTSKGMRGSSAILGAVSLTVAVDGSEGQLRARVDKSNSGADPLPEHYKISPLVLPAEDGETDARDGAVLIPWTGGGPSEELSALILELIRDAYGGEASRSQVAEGLETEHGRKMSGAGVGKVLTALGRSGRLEKIGSGPGTRWKITEDPETLLG